MGEGLGVKVGTDQRRHEATFWGHSNVVYFDRGLVTQVYASMKTQMVKKKTHSSDTLKMRAFH